MPLPIRTAPYSSQGRENHDRIFHRPAAPPPAPPTLITPGVIREYRSKCCGAEAQPDPWLYNCPICRACGKPCVQVLTRIN